MRKWIDQSTFDELLLANAEDNIERAIRSASAVLETVQEFVPEAALFYRVTHAVDSLKNYFEEACTGFRRNGILFLVRRYTSVSYTHLYYTLTSPTFDRAEIDTERGTLVIEKRGEGYIDRMTLGDKPLRCV